MNQNALPCEPRYSVTNQEFCLLVLNERAQVQSAARGKLVFAIALFFVTFMWIETGSPSAFGYLQQSNNRPCRLSWYSTLLWSHQLKTLFLWLCSYKYKLKVCCLGIFYNNPMTNCVCQFNRPHIRTTVVIHSVLYETHANVNPKSSWLSGPKTNHHQLVSSCSLTNQTDELSSPITLFFVVLTITTDVPMFYRNTIIIGLMPATKHDSALHGWLSSPLTVQPKFSVIDPMFAETHGASSSPRSSVLRLNSLHTTWFASWNQQKNHTHILFV